MGRKRTNFAINIPLSYDEITLEMYEKLLQLYDETGNKPSFVQILSVLSGIDEKELNEYPAEVINTIAEKMEYLTHEISKEVSESIEIDGEIYKIHSQDTMKFGEFSDAQTLLKNDKTNFAYLLAIICRKDGEIYNDDFTAKIIDARIKMYEEQPITKVQPLINFLLLLSATSKENIQESLKQLHQAIDQLASCIENSKASGVGKRFSLKLLKKKCKILRKQANNI